MSSIATPSAPREPVRESLRIAGARVSGTRLIEVRHPYSGELAGTVPKATVADVKRALKIARGFRSALTRHDRYKILMQTGEIIASRRNDLARLITLESGLCLKDSRYEVGRASDVLLFAANQALVDDGEIFSCDLTAHGKSRKVYTLKEPLLGVITAITPFNHPLNQVIHKVAPAVATNNRVVLKPSEKTPLTALALADILYEAGLPPEMLSVLTGDPAEIADELLASADVDLVTFTGGVAIGKSIAAKALYKRQVLELGGNDPIIVLEDADLEEAAALAASGSYKNSGQRCTAIKRMLVQEKVADRFVELLVEKTRAVKYGDPFDPAMDMGTVIDEASAMAIRGGRERSRRARRKAPHRQYPPRRTVLADRARPGHAGHDGRAARDLRPGLARDPLQDRGGCDPHLQRNRLWPVILDLHQPPRLDHALHPRVARRQRERSRGPGLPAGNDPLRRHQGLGSGVQRRGPGSHEELLQHEDLFAALVGSSTHGQRSHP